MPSEDFRPSQAWRAERTSRRRAFSFSSRPRRARAMGAAASRPAPRALVDAVEALGGATSAEVLELVDVFARACPRDHVPVTADDVAALSSRSSRRLRTASEVADAFDPPGASRRCCCDAYPPSMTRRAAATARTTKAPARGDLPRRRPRAPGEVPKQRRRRGREADALLRAGALVDLAEDGDDGDDGRTTTTTTMRTRRSTRARALGRAANDVARASRGGGEKVPEPPRDGRSLLLRSARASLAPRLLTTTTGGTSDAAGRVATSSPARSAWLLAASIPSGARRRGCDGKARRGDECSASADDGARFSTFVSRITAKTCGPVLVCVRTKAGDVLGGYVSLGPGESVRGDRAEFQGDAGSFVFAFGKAGKKRLTKSAKLTTTREGASEVDAAADADDDDASEDDARADDSWTRVGVYPSTGANANYAWCAAGFTSDRFPNGFGFGGVADRAGAGRSAVDRRNPRARAVRAGDRHVRGADARGVSFRLGRREGNVSRGSTGVRSGGTIGLCMTIGASALSRLTRWRLGRRRARTRSSAGGTNGHDEVQAGDRGAGGVRDAKHGELRMMMQLGRRDAGDPRGRNDEKTATTKRRESTGTHQLHGRATLTLDI